MKKGIKYAGIAAATLLAVSPVVAPVVGSTTQTVQADQLDSADTKTQVKEALTKLSALYATKNEKNQADFEALNLKSFEYNKPIDYPAFKALDVIKGLNTEGYDLGKVYDTNLANATDVKYIINVLDNNGKARSQADYKKLVDDVTNNGSSITLTITAVDSTKDSKNSDYILGTKTITVTNTQKKVDASKVNFVTLDFTSPLEVNAGSKTVNVTLDSSVDLKATKDSKKIEDAKATAGDDLFTSKSAAQAFIKDSTQKKDKDLFKSATFGKNDDTYYQVITIDTPSVNLTTIYNNHQSGQTDSALLVNGDAPLQYQISHKDAINAPAPSQPGSENGNGAGATRATSPEVNEIKVIREIKVSADKPTDKWTTSAVKGKVVIAKDKIAKLYTTKNELATRSLGGYSGWLTTTKRTNAAGVTQYQVSTDEWINADDVTFVAANSTETNANETDNAAGLTNIQKLTGYHKVTLAGPASFLYSLFDKDMNRSNRVIAGDSAWFTDQTAQDSKGVTYYRISTNEWIPAGNGLTFK